MWNTWVSRLTGEVVESYTMLTLNADAHPLMNRMHKPDPSRPPHAQDKHSVIPIAPADVDQWLNVSRDDVKTLFTLPPLAAFDAVPLDAPRQSSLI